MGKKTETPRLHGLAGRGPTDFQGPCRHPLGPHQVLRAPLESQPKGASTDLLAGNTPGRPTPRLSTATCDLATLGITKATTGERFPKVCPRRFKHLTLIRSRADTKIQHEALWFRATTYLSQASGIHTAGLLRGCSHSPPWASPTLHPLPHPDHDQRAC